jgi:glutathione S-transferase
MPAAADTPVRKLAGSGQNIGGTAETPIRTYHYAYIAAKTLDGRPDRAAIEAVLPEVHEQLGILDRAVEETGYLVGNQFTFADINLIPILERVRLAPEGAEALSASRHLIVMPDTFTDAHRAEITSLAARYSVPAVCPLRFYAEVGCLLSYGPLPIDNFRRAAQYADRILKGEKPSDLPVQAPVRSWLI